MRSALLAVAAFAATVIGHEQLTHNVPRDLPNTRLARRSPAEKAAVDLKDQQDIKCVVQFCGQPTGAVAGGGFGAFFTSVSSVTTFTQANFVFPTPPPSFPGITSLGWDGFSSFFGNNVNGLFTFVTALQGQQAIALQSAVASFQNIVQVLVLITQGFGSGLQWGAIGNFLDPISAVYTQLWQFIQGFMAWISTTFTLNTFGGAVGGNWQLFQQILTQLLSIGQQFQILQTNCLVRGGINLDFFLNQCGFTTFQQYQGLFSYSTSTFISSSFGPWAACIPPAQFPTTFPPFPFPPTGFTPNFIPPVYAQIPPPIIPQQPHVPSIPVFEPLPPFITSHTNNLPPDGDQFHPDGDQFHPDGDQFPPDGDQFHPDGDQSHPDGDQFHPHTNNLPPHTNNLPPHTNNLPPHTNNLPPRGGVTSILQNIAGTRQW
ncbi:hypothetical protein CROQUDRAFT_109123 [Cronartium quercuum f. sp. fusiforme G11]|uniref:Uncharacterized protein n=1 Tax=Cronartium quercuum f. sp. fusiforme G11 TaxID=708437 RepID=A0A9P6NBH5_9BASI|nr:hypothetical protein CROQUDRAFT_109123 [Cronartium quercuum f. sp. fusiforme G11]